jgi:hypothetical protein
VKKNDPGLFCLKKTGKEIAMTSQNHVTILSLKIKEGLKGEGG